MSDDLVMPRLEAALKEYLKLSEFALVDDTKKLFLEHARAISDAVGMIVRQQLRLNQQKQSSWMWLDAAELALAGDLKPLRLRVDMAKAGKPEFVEHSYDNAPTDPHHGGKIWEPSP